MEYLRIEILANEYLGALFDEYEAMVFAANTKKEAETLKVEVLAAAANEGLIDGKNEKMRELQRQFILKDAVGYQAKLMEVTIREASVETLKIDRKHIESLIGLTKAWLYSQSGNR